MNTFIAVATLMFLAAAWLLLQKYRIVLGGRKLSTPIRAISTEQISWGGRWYRKKRYTVEINDNIIYLSYAPIIFIQHRIGDSCTVFYKNRKAVLAYNFCSEVFAILLLLLGAAFLAVGLKTI